jgi:hypothetical protein
VCLGCVCGGGGSKRGVGGLGELGPRMPATMRLLPAPGGVSRLGAHERVTRLGRHGMLPIVSQGLGVCFRLGRSELVVGRAML